MDKKENININDNISYEIENLYLLLSNREKCKSLLQIEEITIENKIDFLISIHLVLEIWINIFFRKLLFFSIIKDYKIIKNYENIWYKEKVVSFIAMLDFNKYRDDIKFNEYSSKLPWKIQKFNEYRNSLLHWHFIWRNQKWELWISKKINEKGICNKQKEEFIYIINGLIYLVDLYDCKIWKEDFKNQFLDKSFLN